MHRKFLKNYPLSLSLAVIITTLSLIPVPDVPQLSNITLLDKWVHFLMYGSLSFCIWVEYLRSHSHVSLTKATLGAEVCPIAMSGLLELAQKYLTTCRSGEWLDFLANSIGVALASAIILLYLIKKHLFA